MIFISTIHSFYVVVGFPSQMTSNAKTFPNRDATMGRRNSVSAILANIGLGTKP